jgi:hypothetical protein
MTYRKVDPLRVLTDEEREVLTHISRAASEPASHVARAKALRSRAGDAVPHPVSRSHENGGTYCVKVVQMVL